MALGQELDRPRPDSELTGPRSEEMACDADVIAEIEQLEDSKVALRQRVLADVHLDTLQAIRECQEARFAEAPNRQDATRGNGLDLLCLERFRGSVAVRGDDGRDRLGAIETVGIGRSAEIGDGFEVLPSLLNLLVFLAHDDAGPAAISPRSIRSLTASSTPLTKGTASSVLKRRASSIASSMTTAGGVPGSCSSS